MAEQCECMKICNKNMKQAHFWIIFALFLLRKRAKSSVLETDTTFFRCVLVQVMEINIDGQITLWSAYSGGMRSVSIRNIPWSCTYKKKPNKQTKKASKPKQLHPRKEKHSSKLFTRTKLARWNLWFCSITWHTGSCCCSHDWWLLSDRTAHTISLDSAVSNGWMKFLPPFQQVWSRQPKESAVNQALLCNLPWEIVSSPLFLLVATQG